VHDLHEDAVAGHLGYHGHAFFSFYKSFDHFCPADPEVFPPMLVFDLFIIILFLFLFIPNVRINLLDDIFILEIVDFILLYFVPARGKIFITILQPILFLFVFQFTGFIFLVHFLVQVF